MYFFPRPSFFYVNIVTYQKEEGTLLDHARKTFVKLYEKQGKLYESENIYKRVFEEKHSILLQSEEKVHYCCGSFGLM